MNELTFISTICLYIWKLYCIQSWYQRCGQCPRIRESSNKGHSGYRSSVRTYIQLELPYCYDCLREIYCTDWGHTYRRITCMYEYTYLLNDELRRRKRKLGSMPHGRIWTSLSSSTRSLNYGCLFHLVKLISGTVISCALKYSPPRRETKDI